uniref:Uncharacterized protein n=1 Tax=Knipowitschia caucasica TaxID=637954 RepID=A0AAV2MJE4_KNICA
MQHSQRLDQKLHVLREEVRTMSREKEQVEKVWRERLQRCQRQLQVKEDEMIRQSQYFESFKSQLQYKLAQGRDREAALQNRIYTLEKQLLDMTVTAATGLATMGPVRITAGSVTNWEVQDKLPPLRGEGEGEEEKKEDRKKQWPKNLEVERDKDSDQSRLQGFILSLQEDLRVLLEREEQVMTEQRALMEQLHEAQESSHFLGCKVEEMKSEVEYVNLSKVSLDEEVEELREENQRLQQILREAEDLPNADVCTQKADISDEQPAVVAPHHHQAEAEPSQTDPVESSSAAKSEPSFITVNEPQTAFDSSESKSNAGFHSLALTTETIDELRMGAWCYNGVLNLEESPGEDSDALREAYHSLGLGGDLDFIKEQRDRFEEALQQTHQQLKMAVLENQTLRSQMKQQEEEAEESREDSSNALDDSARFSIGSDDLVQALNEENRALAERIQELREHIELREEGIMKDKREVEEQICRLEIDGARQQQEINEQACLVTELTRKTEDDLNTIMELRQKLQEHEELRKETRRKKLFGFQSKHTQTVFRKDNIDECVDIVVNCVIESDAEPQFLSKQENLKDVSQVKVKSSDNPEVSLMNEEVDRLSKLVQSLKAEHEDLTGRMKSQTLQQKDVSQSIRTQTEEKQRLTREVWGLKEEKDRIFKSLSGLKQERDMLARAVCGFKDEKQQFQRSMTGELKSLEDARDQQHLYNNLEAERAELQQSVSSLKEEERRITFSVSRLKQEENQMVILKQQLHEEHSRLQATIPRQTKTCDTPQQANYEEQHDDQRDLEDQEDLQIRIQTLSAELQKTQADLEETTAEGQRLQSELVQSESRGDEVERRTSHLAKMLFKVSDESSQLQETRKECDALKAHVKDLQNKATLVVREKTEALVLKARLEEQYNILTAQLKAKTVALQELNSEYISLKRGQANKEDLNTVLVSVQTRYHDVRAKYDALLHSKSQADMDVAPLKAKLSCLVLKCQERNNILVQMTKLLQKHGGLDYILKQQVEQLLSDPALHSYASAFPTAFTPEIRVTFEETKRLTQDQRSSPISTVSPHHNRYGGSPSPSSFANSPRDCISKASHESGSRHKASSPRYISPLPEHREEGSAVKDNTQLLLSPTNQRRQQLYNASTLVEKKALSPNAVSPIQQKREMLGSTSPAASQKNNSNSTVVQHHFPPRSRRGFGQKAIGFHQLNMKAKSSPDLSRSEYSGFCSSTGSSSSLIFGSNTRLSSPEKIMSLQEQLQKTLISSFQVHAYLKMYDTIP